MRMDAVAEAEIKRLEELISIQDEKIKLLEKALDKACRPWDSMSLDEAIEDAVERKS